MDFLTAIKKLRAEDKRNFDQTFDLIVNLKNYDLRTKPINLVVEMPKKFRDVKICAFLEGSSNEVDKVITKNEIPTWKEPKDIKKLAKEYDFFISSAKLMPAVATTFGKILGPLGKMPNPKFGAVIMKEESSIIKEIADKFRKNVAIRPKEASIKIAVGKESMSDADINENINAIYSAIVSSITKECIKSVLLKLTMTKPVKVI